MNELPFLFFHLFSRCYLASPPPLSCALFLLPHVSPRFRFRLFSRLILLPSKLFCFFDLPLFPLSCNACCATHGTDFFKYTHTPLPTSPPSSFFSFCRLVPKNSSPLIVIRVYPFSSVFPWVHTLSPILNLPHFDSLFFLPASFPLLLRC